MPSNHVKKLLVWGGAIVVSLLGAWTAPAQQPPLVREVVIRHEGPPAAAESVIRANIRTQVGQPYSAVVVNNDVRTLFEKGWFANVQVRTEPLEEGLRVIFLLQGKPKVRDIIITGNKRVKTARLKKELAIKVGDALEGGNIERSVAKLSDYYQRQGYQLVQVVHEEAVDPETGQAVVTFHINEGDRITVDRVDFVGNNAFTAKQLRRQIRTKGHWMFSWLSRANRLREEVFEQDKQRLIHFYQSHGYIDVEIRDVKVERVRPDRVRLEFSIFEGKQYKTGQIRIEGNEKFSTQTLTQQLRMSSGKTFTPKGLEDDIRALTDFYGSKGYLDLAVIPDRSPNIETGQMDVIYRLREGEISYIEKIEIRGNTKTKDKVIRRELAVRPGQIFDMVKVRRSQQRLEGLNYFEKVHLDPEPTEVENRKNLSVEVVEKRTGSINFGFGASNVEQIFGFVEVSQSNFDLFRPPWFEGGGQKMRARASVGTKSQYYLLSFTEPWFLDRKLLLGFDLFRDELRFVSREYSLRQFGGAIRMAKALDEVTSGEIKYELKEITIFDVDSSASPEVAVESGRRLKSSFTFSLRRDTRDNYFIPNRGYRADFMAQFAGGPLGGDTDIYKFDLRSTHFLPLWRKHVLMVKLATGVADTHSGGNRVPIFDRFFLGGPNSMRGFRYNDVGPKSPGADGIFGTDDTGEGDSIGGNTYAYATVEYLIPVVTLPQAGVRFAVFYDVGQVWSDSYQWKLNELNDDVGVGLRLDLKFLPIRFDYAWPLRTDDFNDDGPRFNFSLGYQF